MSGMLARSLGALLFVALAVLSPSPAVSGKADMVTGTTATGVSAASTWPTGLLRFLSTPLNLKPKALKTVRFNKPVPLPLPLQRQRAPGAAPRPRVYEGDPRFDADPARARADIQLARRIRGERS